MTSEPRPTSITTIRTTPPVVEKLKNKEDYNTWKFGMKLILMREKLWGYAMGATTATNAEKDMEAWTLILLHVDKSLYAHVENTVKAKEAWDVLESLLAGKTKTRWMNLWDALLDTTLSKFDGSVQNYITHILDITNKLQSMGKPVEDGLIALIMLRGLPKVCLPYRMGIESSTSDENFTSENIKGKLLNGSLEEYLDLDRSSSNSALVSKHNKKPQLGSFKVKPVEKKTVKCFNCWKYGHFKYECPQKQASSRKKAFKEDDSSLFCALGVSAFNQDEWIIDSGASSHMTSKKEWLQDFVPIEKQVVKCADNTELISEGRGNVAVKSHDYKISAIKDVTFVPGLATNLLSVAALVRKDINVVFDQDGCKLFRKDSCNFSGELLCSGSESNGIYKLDSVKPVFAVHALAISAENKKENLWHRRLGHVRVDTGLKLCLQNEGVKLECCDSELVDKCKFCVLGKMSKFPFPKTGGQRASEVLGLVHMDLCGPMEQPSHNMAKYMFVLVDDFSRRVFCYFLKSKDQTFECFCQFKTWAENRVGSKIKAIRTDNGTEFVNSYFDSFLSDNGIEHQTSVPYSPEQNGVVERANRSICEMARCMLYDSGLSKQYWAEACNTAVYIKNRVPHSALNGKTPQELWKGKKSSLNHLRVFGCPAFLHVPDHQRTKWDAKARELIFVGYDEVTKGYRLIDPQNPKKIVKGRSVVFHENGGRVGNVEVQAVCEDHYVFWPAEQQAYQSEADGLMENSSAESDGGETDQDSDYTPDAQPVVDSDESEILEDEWKPPADGQPVRRSARVPKPKEFSDHVTYLTSDFSSSGEDPMNLEDAMSRSDSEEWIKAMEEEMQCFKDNSVWELVDPPKGANIVGNKWVFKLKRNSDGTATYRARLVAKGFSQKLGVDYDETFSPVVRRSTLRALLSLAVNLNLKINHFDIKTAFLNGDLKETIFMKQPEGFMSKNCEGKVCKLSKAIYGLKQSARQWNDKAKGVLQGLGYAMNTDEDCVFIKRSGESVAIVALYVDDFYVFYNNTELKDKLFQGLCKYFKVKDLGEARSCLGMRITRNWEEGSLKIDQESYVVDVLKRFNMYDCIPIGSPMETGLKLWNVQGDKVQVPYQELVGCLLYISTNTRPDISYAASILSQYNSKFTSVHWKAAKRVLRYLKGTINYGIVFHKSDLKDLNVTGFVDSNFVDDLTTGLSQYGSAFMFGGNLISWESKKLKSVATSTTEAEYAALNSAAKEAVYLRRLAKELLHRDDQKAVIIFHDNQSSIKLSQNPVIHSRLKHVCSKGHFVRQCVKQNEIVVKYLQSKEMPADILTKPLAREQHMYLVHKLKLLPD